MQEDHAIPTSESSLQVNIFLQDVLFILYNAFTLHNAVKKSDSNIKLRHCCSASADLIFVIFLDKPARLSFSCSLDLLLNERRE